MVLCVKQTNVNYQNIVNIYRDCRINANPNDFQFIDSIKYKDLIIELTKPLYGMCGFSYFTICLHFYRGDSLFLSNDPGNIIIPYRITPLGRIDSLFSKQLHTDDHFFPTEEDDSFQLASTQAITDVFGVHPAYVLRRQCNECVVFISAAHSRKINDPKSHYQKTIDRFEDFNIDFLDKTIPILADKRPNLRHLKFFSDPFFRRVVIKCRDWSRAYKLEELSDKQIACLQLSARGFKSNQISKKLNLSVATVNTYMQRCQEILRANNRSHAITIAISLGLIEPGD